ncbi:hypothetical protein RBU60_01875 [Mesonia sp. MT50]|uniref:Uncharacterized protein n=1 Tax=Mesonia profundi TaxID=3070998 RepID=A0ABU0ZXW4_9FLAO|nr:hypothetical protein [Mesonia profundi]MDQ7916308.1 hypothetical protein [Mesonia profundi]
MDIETRKIEFVQEFLKLQSEEVISKFEKILKKEKESSNDSIENSMTKEELNARIEKSESDFKNKRCKKTSELLEKYR